jgi:abhydrolase domain-containing protein 6
MLRSLILSTTLLSPAVALAVETQSKMLSVGNQTVAYLQAGSGPALVIIHGIGGHKEDWQSIIDAMADSHTVYAIDMIGFGGSSKTAPTITIADQADAVVALLDAEMIAKADLIGNSVGGWVAATVAANHPDRTERLVLVDPAGFAAMFEGPSPVNFYPTTVEDMQNTLSFVLHSDWAHTPEFATKALDALNASGDAATAERVFAGLFTSTRLEELMPLISAPTLVVWGAEDRLFPPALADMVAGSIAGAEKVLIPAAGHFPQIDNLDGFLGPVQAFLAQQ